MTDTDTFNAKVQAQNRVAIPDITAELLKIKPGTTLKITVEVIKR